jgi:GNAT superfamily N-acetyltransferase
MDQSTEPDMILRRLEFDDLPAAHQLSIGAAWPHRLEDWRFMLGLGSAVAAFDGGELVGTASWWPYGDAFATLGMVIVSPSRQGRNIGRRLMEAVLREVGDRTVVLNATEAGLRLYESTGFRPVGKVYQHQGAAFSAPLAALPAGDRIRPVGRTDQSGLIELDRAASGLQRDRLLTALFEAAEGVVLESRGQAVGFSLFRRFGRGYAIGPVVAPTVEGAKALVSHWLGSHAGMFLRTDVPGTSGLSEWLEERGLERVGEVTTMVRGELPKSRGEPRLFALVSQALG